MWLECGCNAGAMREQRGDNPGVKWVQNGCKAGAKRVHAITILQVLFKGAKTGAKEF